MRAHTLENHVKSDLVMSALWDDYICLALAWLDKLLVHGLNCCEVLVDDALEAPAAVTHVAHDAAQNTNVRVCVDVDLDIHKVAQFPALEYQNPFERL